MPRKCWSCLESRILLTSYLISPSISIGGGGGCEHCRKGSGVNGSNWEMWKTGCMERNWLGSQRVNECEPGVAMIL